MQRRILLAGAGLLGVCLAASAAYVWRERNIDAARRLADADRPAAAGAHVRRVRIGDSVPEFAARDLDGRELRVAARGAGNSLLFIYDPNCHRCEAAIPGWEKLDFKLRELRAPVEVVALSVADPALTARHARAASLSFRVVSFPSLEMQRLYGATEVPLTVVVGPEGRVRGVWDKPLEQGEVGDVLEFVCAKCFERAAFARPSPTEVKPK